MNTREAQKKAWSTPRLIEHGDIERLTGLVTDPVRVNASGLLKSRPTPS